MVKDEQVKKVLMPSADYYEETIPTSYMKFQNPTWKHWKRKPATNQKNKPISSNINQGKALLEFCLPLTLLKPHNHRHPWSDTWRER